MSVVMKEEFLKQFQLLTLNRQTAKYFFSKDGFIWDQQRITVQSLQPQQAISKSPQSKGRTFFLRREINVGRVVVNKGLRTFHWLSPCPDSFSSADVALLLSQGVIAPPSGLPILLNCCFCSLIFIQQSQDIYYFLSKMRQVIILKIHPKFFINSSFQQFSFESCT